MGHFKLFLPIDGVPLIVRAYKGLAAISSHVRVIGAPPEAVDMLAKWNDDAIRRACFPDDQPDAGPLAGFMTGLRHTDEPMALCLAVDQPLPTARCYKHS